MSGYIRIFFAIILLILVSGCGEKKSSTEGVQEQSSSVSKEVSASEERNKTDYVLSLNAKTGEPEILGFSLNSNYSKMVSNWSSMFSRMEENENNYETDEDMYPFGGLKWLYFKREGGKLALLDGDHVSAGAGYLKDNPDKIHSMRVESDTVRSLSGVSRWISPQFFKEFKGDVYISDRGGDLIFAINNIYAIVDAHSYNWEENSSKFIVDISLSQEFTSPYAGNSEYWEERTSDKNKVTLDEARAYYIKNLATTEEEYQKAEKAKTEIDAVDEAPVFEPSNLNPVPDLRYRDFLELKKEDQLIYLDEYLNENSDIDATAEFLQEALNDSDLKKSATEETLVQELVSYMVK
ncbi:hypothetical protein [Peribacillus simplex]|uniref:hypothetical protein n=1 Tax=Peribacillus simplex TaxID=1478 RepID=UPI003D2BB5CC